MLLLPTCTPAPTPPATRTPAQAPAPAPASPAAESWKRTEAEILKRFPKVSHLRRAQVESLLAETRPVILDVRASQEFAVSHLQGARNLPLGDALSAAVAGLPRDRSILIYCSVGYRSAEAAEELRKAGFERVHNYLGSIFDWANAGQPLVNDRGPTNKVHPYDKKWGQMLRRDAWSF